MRNHRFTFVIEGDGVSPNTVSVRDLYDVVSNLEAAIAITARYSGASDDDDLMLSLVDISPGSDTLTCAVSAKMYGAASVVSHGISSRDFSRIPVPAHPRLYALQRKASNASWSLGFHANGNGIARAVIRPDDELFKPPRIEGSTTLYGRCDRPGGERPPTARLTLLTGERVAIRLANRQLAKQIGMRLFEVIGLEGVATWNTEDWSLASFKAQRLTEYHETDPVTAFRHLADAADGFWDTVDPDAFVADLRAD